jgi:type I pantothenate kinase
MAAVPYVELTGEEWRVRSGRGPGEVDPITADHRPLADLVADLVADRVTRPQPGHGPTVVVGVTGGVAVGKSVTAAALGRTLEGDHGLRSEVVATDGFLLPNRVLAERGLAERKGYPESYDHVRLVAFLEAVTAGTTAEAPRYDHDRYDVRTDGAQVVDHPEVLVVEGLNVLQPPPPPLPSLAPFDRRRARRSVADFLDLSVYVDADEADLHAWFLARFRALRAAAAGNPDSFFAGFDGLSTEEFDAIGDAVWFGVNRPNLVEHVAPTRERADVVLEKAADHTVRRAVVRRG